MTTQIDYHSLDEEIKNIIYCLYDFKAQKKWLKQHRHIESFQKGHQREVIAGTGAAAH